MGQYDLHVSFRTKKSYWAILKIDVDFAKLASV